MTNPSKYTASGVDIAAGDAFIHAIAPHAKATSRPGVAASGAIGGFAALFDPRAAGYQDPILVAATDGVGTKLLLAEQIGDHGSIGQDLVAMCVNDLICTGAEPLFFLDYFATGKLRPGIAETVVAGIAAACSRAGCGLIGGETAELPGLYSGETYDLAGFAIGAYERGTGLDSQNIVAGDHIIAIPSSGIHSNGYSLVRKIVETEGADLFGPPPYESPAAQFGADLLTPTALYPQALMPSLQAQHIKGLAHITGGGLAGNLCRILPPETGAKLDATAWHVLPVFQWLAAAGDVPATEMVQVFNCGVGLLAITAPNDSAAVISNLENAGLRASVAGEIVNQSGANNTPDSVEIAHLEKVFS